MVEPERLFTFHFVWTAEEVDKKLKQMTKNIQDKSAAATAKYGLGYDLVAGANIAVFEKVAHLHDGAGPLLSSSPARTKPPPGASVCGFCLGGMKTE